MAFEIPGFKPGNFVAGADLSAHQYKFVTLNSSGLVILCNASSNPIGILQDKPAASGRSAEVMCSGISKLIAGEAITLPSVIGPDANGKADGSSPTKIVGHAIEGAANADEVMTVMFDCQKPHS